MIDRMFSIVAGVQDHGLQAHNAGACSVVVLRFVIG
jgi:hypothetical protein